VFRHYQYLRVFLTGSVVPTFLFQAANHAHGTAFMPDVAAGLRPVDNPLDVFARFGYNYGILQG
jgi:hypothetical protein